MCPVTGSFRAEPLTDAALLTLSELTVSRAEVPLFLNLELVVLPGQCWSLTGPNGCGKTTLLRSIAGLHSEHQGGISTAPFAFLGHRPGVNLALSPMANLRWYQRLFGVGGDLPRKLQAVGLAGYESVPCGELSAGQLRRVALARLSLQPARLWLLDEPYTALDGAGQALLDELLLAHARRGGAAVCATHQPLGQGGRFPEQPASRRSVTTAMVLEQWLPALAAATAAVGDPL